jgi:AraC family transcriptional regulator of arabinose operon
MKGFDFFFEEGDFYQDSDLSIINVGLSHNEPGFTFGHDWRTYYILHYVVSGSGIYTVNNSTYTLNKQNCFLVPPNTPVIYKADDKDPWTCYWVGFKGNKAKKYIERVFGKDKFTYNFDHDISYITSYFESMFQEVSNEHYSPLIIEGLCYQIFGNLIKEKSNYKTKKTKLNKFKEIDRIMHSTVRNNYQIQDISNAVSLSCSQIYRIIKRETGLSPHEYLDKLKIEKAINFIESTDLSYKEISLLLGYQYESHFYNTFKKVTGKKPSDYRI